jgi:CRP-like cAMP-binding protein
MDALPSTLPNIGILTVLTDSQRAALSVCGEFQRLALGAHIVKQGVQQDHLHLVIEGVMTATSTGGMRVIELGEVRPGELIGELNFVDPLKASASVRAKVSSIVWSISCEELHRFCDTDPAVGLLLMREISRLLARRIRKAADKMLRQPGLEADGFASDF